MNNELIVLAFFAVYLITAGFFLWLIYDDIFPCETIIAAAFWPVLLLVVFGSILKDHWRDRRYHSRKKS